jgi:signal peptide peptidase SppA
MPDMNRFVPFMKAGPVVSVIRLQGMIASGAQGLNDRTLAPLVERAFARGKPVAVALEINSPGGSPVQSSLIAARIRRLAAEKRIPVIAFVEDVAASGGYWLATAADEILVDGSSIVGSIGVISASFGLQDAIGRIGVERRVHTAGKSKSMLDPFRAQNPDDVARLHTLLGDIHTHFIDHVRTRRGDKLTDNPDLFTGDVFIGRRAVDQGLADGIGHLMPVLKARFGADVRLRRYGTRKSFWRRFGAHILDDAVGLVEERAAYARFGL